MNPPFHRGSHACFFYTTLEEFFEISLPYLKEGLERTKERCLWILPPEQRLDPKVIQAMEPYVRQRKLIMTPWEKWYGTEQSIHIQLKRTQQLLKETLQEGFGGLRVLSHSPHRASSYWKDFFLYEEGLPKRLKSMPFLSLCAYSLIDCPAHAIPSIALNHSLCLIHRGSEWEWLSSRRRFSHSEYESL